MILKEEILPIGQITKPHGLKGEMTFTAYSTILEDVDVPFVILEPDGLLVPFYIESIRMKTDTTGLIKLERVDSDEQARELIGQTIYLPNHYLDEIEDDEFELEYFIGFEVFDATFGKIGKIIAVDESTTNTLFVVEHGDNEVLIPAAEEFIDDMNHEKRVISLNLPEGLLDL